MASADTYVPPIPQPTQHAAPPPPMSSVPQEGAAPTLAPNASGLVLLLGRLKDYAGTVFKQDIFSQQKPWSEMTDRGALSKPPNLGEAISRIKKNVAYFRVNYCVAVAATCVASFLFHPTSLIVLGMLLLAWGYMVFVKQSPLVISGRQISEREKLLGMAVISFITIFFLTEVGTVLLSAVGLSLSAILLHGAFREPDNLFLDDGAQEQSFFNILSVGNPTQPSGPAAV